MQTLTPRLRPQRAAPDVVGPLPRQPSLPVWKPDGRKAEPPSRRKRRSFARDILIGFFAVAVLHAFVVQVSVVRGHSMEPCLHDGDRLVVDRVGADLVGVSRFDVVVLGNPRDPSIDYVKRVAGLPGERVALHDGHLWVDGRELSEGFGPIADHAEFPTVVVPPEHVFVLGDNRPISCDSREFGLVPLALVRGTVRARFWPLDRIAVF